MGLTVLFLSLVGTALAPPRFRWMLLGLWIGYLLYGLVLPFQMFTHSYYHLQLVPVIALGLVPVAEALVKAAGSLPARGGSRPSSRLVALRAYEILGGALHPGGRGLRASSEFWATVGSAIPADADVTALTQDYGFDLMYWGWRKVRLWPLNTALSELRSGDRTPCRTVRRDHLRQ